MSTGDTASVTMIVNKSNTAHIATTIQIDGTDVTPEFLGGVHNDGGGNNTFDVCFHAIIQLLKLVMAHLQSSLRSITILDKEV